MGTKAAVTAIAVLLVGLGGNAVAQIDPNSVTTGHVYLFEDVVDANVPDDSANDHLGVIIGAPQVVDGPNGKALQFNGVDDGVDIPDSEFINVTGGPFPNRTVFALFRCDDVTKQEKQTVFEEGGLTRGLTIYVFDSQVYVGGWNKAEYQWNPGSWISAPIDSNDWHAVALVIRDGGDAQEEDKFEMWMDGALIGKAPGGQIYNHGNDNGIGYTKQNNVFHDGDASGDGWFFQGAVDEVWILNDALTPPQLAALAGTTWPTAYGPTPSPGAVIEDFMVTLSWGPGDFALSHDVYLGTSLDDVAAGAAAALLGNQVDTSLLVTDLVPDSTYYWRVDEINEGEPDSPWAGDVWSFSLPPRRAYDPQPSDGQINVLTAAQLTWTPGWNPLMHSVYFGTDKDEVAAAAGGMPQMEITSDPGPLEVGTTYYWRVDEFYNGQWVAGPVWSFTTVPDVPAADDPNLVAWYPLDEGEGQTALDWSGNNAHGGLSGDVQWAEGIDGGALAFDGSGGDYVEAPDAPNVAGTNSRTVAAWIKTTDYGEIASWGQDAAGQKWIFRVQESNGTLGAIRVEVNGGYQVGSTDVRDDEWYHVAAVLVDDGSPDVNEIALYVNGRLEVNSAQLDEPIDTAAGVVRIGQSPWGSRPFTGLIDDVRIYDAALTQEEIAQAAGDILATLPVVKVSPAESVETTGDDGMVISINGIPAEELILGTTTTDFEKHADHLAPDADDFDLSTYASLDDSSFISMTFAEPVTTVFIVERGANDLGFIQALDAAGDPIGGTRAFSKDDWFKPGIKISGQDAGAIVVTSAVPISGIMILPPEDANMGLDPASVSAMAVDTGAVAGMDEQ